MEAGCWVAGSIEFAINSVWHCFYTPLIYPNNFWFVSLLTSRLLLALFVRKHFVWVDGVGWVEWSGWLWPIMLSSYPLIAVRVRFRARLWQCSLKIATLNLWGVLGLKMLHYHILLYFQLLVYFQKQVCFEFCCSK